MAGVPEVAAAVKIIPAKRTAVYDVDLVTRDPSVDMRGRRWPAVRAELVEQGVTE